eukprot:gene9957-1795_t
MSLLPHALPPFALSWCTPQRVLSTCRPLPLDQWVPHSSRFVSLGELPRGTGALCVWDLEGGKLVKQRETERREGGFKCGTFGSTSDSTRHLATGGMDGRVQVWDVETGKTTWDVKGHSKIINAIDGALFKGPGEIVTGSRDGRVSVWDPRQEHAVATLKPEDQDEARDCWAVAFGNSYDVAERCVAAGFDNGDLKYFDLRTNQMVWETNTGTGICSLDFDRKDIQANKLLASNLDGSVFVYDMRTKHETLGYAKAEAKPHNGTIWAVRSEPHNREVFMTMGAGELALHRYSYPDKRKIFDPEGKAQGVAGSVEMLTKVYVAPQP